MKNNKKSGKKEDFAKKNPKLEVLKKLPPEVLARAIKSKMNEEDNQK